MGLLDEYASTIGNLATTGSQVYQAVAGNPAVTPPAASANANARADAAEPGWKKYLPIGIGAVALIVLVALLRRK